jgi:hypothetical protein
MSVTNSVTQIMHHASSLTEGELALNIIQDTIQAAQVGEEIVFKNLTMFPLFVSETVEQEYQTLDEALAAGTGKVTEVSDSGSVPELQFLNEGNRPVLLLDGEELVGAKQNRVLNLSILAPAQKEITIPVSCVEQGRWAQSSTEFRSEDRVHYSRGRSAKAASVSRSMVSEGSRRSDQSEVWQNISGKSARMGVSSPTDSMSDVYEDRKRSVEEFVGAFSNTENQIGAIFGIDGAVSGIDLFDAPDTFSKLMPKLVRSHALDALEIPVDRKTAMSETEIRRFIDILSAVETQQFPAVGLGDDVRLTSQMISGGALVNDGRIVHLGAFPVTSEANDGRSPRQPRMMRASRRRRTH